MIKTYIKILISIFENLFTKEKIIYISDSADWIINVIGLNLKKNLTKITFKPALNPIGLRNKIIHFGSVSSLIKSSGIKKVHRSNKIILTWFHIVENDARTKFIPELSSKVDYIHTSAENTKNKLINFGFPASKIIVIPLGINPDNFFPYPEEKKENIRNKLKIPEKKIVIGSFQKDGNGWGEGFEPKLIKGPDIFCDAVIELNKRYDIFVLLSGPARGYVKKRLDKAQVQYIHKYLDDYEKISEFYNALDLYLVTSREEGLPMAILESLACGVPLISTKVGLAPEIINNTKNGFLCNIEDTENIVKRASRIIENTDLKEKITEQGLHDIKNYTWEKTAEMFYEKIYRNITKR